MTALSRDFLGLPNGEQQATHPSVLPEVMRSLIFDFLGDISIGPLSWPALDKRTWNGRLRAAAMVIERGAPYDTPITRDALEGWLTQYTTSGQLESMLPAADLTVAEWAERLGFQPIAEAIAMRRALNASTSEVPAALHAPVPTSGLQPNVFFPLGNLGNLDMGGGVKIDGGVKNS